MASAGSRAAKRVPAQHKVCCSVEKPWAGCFRTDGHGVTAQEWGAPLAQCVVLYSSSGKRTKAANAWCLSPVEEGKDKPTVLPQPRGISCLPF